MLALANKLTNSTQPIYRFVNKYSIDFDGVDDVIVTDGADTVAQPTTYSFWCKSTKTTENTVFGHGGNSIGRFGLNSGNKPILHLGAGVYQYWVNIPQQDDGEWHHWVLYADTNTITNSQLYCDGVLQNKSISNAGTATAYTESLTIGGDKATSGNYFEGQIDEFAVFDRELTQDEITRMYNTYYSPNRVANGNFSQIGNEEVTNGDFSQIGAEEVRDGNFPTPNTEWGTGAGWSIADNKATSAGANEDAYLTQSNMVLGKTYKVTFDVDDYTSGALSVRVFGQSQVLAVTSTGSYIVYLTPVSTTVLGFRSAGGAGGYVGSIENVSVKEVGQDWTLGGTDWSIGDSKLIGVNAITETSQQILPTTIARNLKISFDVVVDSGSIAVYMTDEDKTWITSSTSIIKYVTSSSRTLEIDGRNSDPFNGSITNISVKEIGQGWTFGTGWSMGDGVATSDGTTENLDQDALITGKTYKAKVTVSNMTTGTLSYRLGGSSSNEIINISSNGEYTANGISGGVTLRLRSQSGFDGSVDNIVVQELKHDATNLMLNAGAYQSANPLITSTNSMEFDGSDDYLQLSEPFSHTNHTITGWFKTDVDNVTQLIFDAADTNIDGIRVWFDSSSVLTYRVGDSSASTLSSGTLVADKWYNFACTYDGATQTMYIDGVSVISQGASRIISTTTNATIGKGSYTDSFYFNGNITEVGAYNRTLTSLEVASLYNQGMPTNLLVNRNDYQSGNPTVFNTKQVDFDGTDDYMIANSTLGSMTGSVSMWVKRGSNTTIDFLIEFRGLGGTGTGFVFLINNSSTISVSSGTVYVDGVAGTTISVGQWHHIVVTGMTLDITESILFGRQYPSAHYLDGDMSQVGLWNSTLTADEVSSLYNHGLPIDLKTNQAAYTSSSNLVGYWRMGSGTLDSYPLIADQTNATLGNSIWDGASGSTTGWVNFGNNTHQTVGDALLITYVDNSAGVYIYLRDSSQLSTDLTVGKAYVINFDTKVTSGSVVWTTQDLGGINYYAPETSSTSYINQTITIVANSTNSCFLFPRQYNSAASVFIKNIKVQEVQGNPAIMTNQTSSDIENGSPYANIVQNGTFDTDSDWTKQGTWVISSGKASSTSVNNGASLYQDKTLIVGNRYKIEYTITDYTSGELKCRLGNNYGAGRTSTGTFIEFIQYTSAASQRVGVQTIGDFVGSIDNVTVEEVNTGLQGYWKMGDGTNDEYPVIYDQTNPTLGSEIVVNGDGSSTTGWGLAYTNTTLSINNNHLRATANASGAYGLSQSLSLDTTKQYIIKATINVDNASGSTANFRIATSSNLGNNTVTLSTATGTSTTILSPSAATMYIGIVDTANDSSNYVEIDNISVKEISGNPATMTNMVEGNITNQYPLTKIRNYYRMGDGILDGYPIIQDQTSPNLAHIPTTNEITYSEDFSQSFWTKAGATVISGQSSPSLNSPLGAYKFVENDANTLHAIYQNANINLATGKHTISIFVKANGRDYFQIRTGSAGGITNAPLYANFNLLNNTITAQSSGAFNAEIKNISDGWKRVSVSFTVTSTSSVALVYQPITTPTAIIAEQYLGDGTSGIYIFGSQVEEQSQATAYLKSDGIASVRKATTTNLITYSEDFTQSSWTKSGVTQVTSNQATSPDGTKNADLIVSDGTTGVFKPNISVTGVVTRSVYLKSVTGTVNVILKDPNLTITSKSLSVTTEWQRFELTENNGTSLQGLWVDDIPSSGIYAWGAQVEQQTQAETYAPTFGLPVTIDLFTENNYGTMTNMVAGDIVPDTPNN